MLSDSRFIQVHDSGQSDARIAGMEKTAVDQHADSGSDTRAETVHYKQDWLGKQVGDCICMQCRMCFVIDITFVTLSGDCQT